MASASCRRPYPGTEVAPCPFAALIVILATAATAFINPAVFGMFEMPLVPNVQLAQQGLDHDTLRFTAQRSVPLMMAPAPSLGKCQFAKQDMPQPDALLIE
jgi:hypothetical protein